MYGGRRRDRSPGTGCSRAALFLALLLRIDAELGYRWQSWFNDSFSYVRAAVTLTPETTRPSGYAVFLWLLSPAHSYLLVTATQHLMGLLVAVMIYALARHRFGAPAWLAVLVTLPVLFDGFEIQLEHLIMADTLFLFLAMAGGHGGAVVAAPVVAGLPRGRPAARPVRHRPLHRPAAARGARGLPGHRALAVAGGRWRPALAVGVVAFGVPLAGYEAWYQSAHGEFAMTDSTGVFLYSRVMTFADCSRMSLPADLLPLCTSVPPSQRPIAQAYIWTQASPLRRLPEPMFSPTVNALAERFAIKAIEAQPLDYARAVVGRHRAVLRVEPLGLPQPADLRRLPVRVPPRRTYRLSPFGGYSVGRGVLRAR